MPVVAPVTVVLNAVGVVIDGALGPLIKTHCPVSPAWKVLGLVNVKLAALQRV